MLSELDGESIQEVLADLLHSDVAWLLKDLGPDDVAYILGFLPEDRGKEILALMKAEDSTEVQGILKYAKDTAGGIMTTEFFSLPEDATAQEAISAGFTTPPMRKWFSISMSRTRTTIWSACCRCDSF